MESLEERKCQHDKGGDMVECQGDVVIKLEIRFKAKTICDKEYIVPELEDSACEDLFSHLPEEYKVDIQDVTVKNSEITGLAGCEDDPDR